MTDAEVVAAAVARIALDGAPRSVLVDADAIGADDTAVGRQVLVLLDALGLDVVTLPIGSTTVVGPSVAVLGRSHAPVDDCYAWYVGPGAAPAWMHATDGEGPATTVRLLSLLGTGLAQERAAAAFSAAGRGQPAPLSARYDASAMLGGITASVSPAPYAVEPHLLPRRGEPDVEELLRLSVAALDRCCAPNGAIAAAPRAPAGRPDYWFFWQRDAANVAIALGALATSGGPDHVTSWARARANGYVGFVDLLGRSLHRHPGGAGFSRCTMTGEPVVGYGDPQPDGPAATALAVLALVPEPTEALRIARPFLDHLADGGALRPGFDLWELTVGRSFHATNLARRVLRRAADLASTTDDPSAECYRRAADVHAARLDDFADLARDHLVHVLDPLPPWFAATSRLDISAIGSTLTAFGADDDDAFGVDDPRVAATMRALEQHFDARWPVNGGIGRFPEDCNDGAGSTHGSPWPIATLWAAQYHLRRSKPDRELARDYLDFVLAHADPAAISEQIDGVTGAPRGVAPLAWAHGELIVTLLALTDVPER